ncbi:beta-phosphoglucomutase [Butyrivibrio sp. LC3010]|uniref:beta-phosphoglucomutase n=1 Tax=Butyrivibrio sp. LC3010 TaxID=1280680 RepID=UPI0004272285|nr:beta-phosphoglucomutase [Butyrivibrio sp. LC3010]
MEIKAVIFDLDGVLVFTDKYHFLAWKQIANELGIDFTEKDNDRLRGVSRADSLEIILEKYQGEELSKDDKEALLKKKNDIYVEQLKQMSPADVTSDVRDTLKALRDRGIKVAVGSSSKNTAYILERTDLTSCFDAVADGTHITRSKPDPEVFLKAAEFVSEDPAYCLVVEDADAGIDAAIAAGMHSAAIGAATRSNRAEINIDSVKDILNIL